MIIKKVNIIAFGGLENKIIEFNDGINIIYGENEAGKSTIQSFIKIWLYGFNNLRSKDLRLNERLRYMPLSGEKIRGELYLEHEGKSYIIKRSFGNTKKEDNSIIIDGLTGEEIKNIPLDEPGKYFLSINRSTFVKTLFIGQLAVEVNKDKDEEIIDKILNTAGVGEGDVTVDKAFLRLENYKKALVTSRKAGSLDKLKEKYSTLLTERYEGYNLSEHNLDNEESLIKLKKEKDDINEELSNLEIYKKYLKKVKLQKEYEELSKYLRKKEELQKEEKLINNEITYKSEAVTLSFIDDLKEEYSMYLSLLDLKNDDELKLNEKLKELEKVKAPLSKYNYIDILGENISKELIRLKIEQDSLKEKIDINKRIDNEILFLENKEKETKEHIGNAYNMKGIRDEVALELELYEEKLRNLKSIMENKNDFSKINGKSFKLGVMILSAVLGVTGIMVNNTLAKLMLFILTAMLISISFCGRYISSFKKKRYINLLKKDINDIEKKLDIYNNTIGVNDFGQLFRSIKLYDEYISIKEKVQIKIEEKISQKRLLNLESAIEKYNNNNEIVKKYLKLSAKESLDDLIQEIYEYEDISKNYKTLEYDIKKSKESLDRCKEQLSLREERLIERLTNIGLENIKLLDLGERLKELREKIIQKEEVHRNLLSIEETYSALSKDKNIDSIKDELKEIIDITFKYSYKKEDEVDDVIREKSKRLLQVEKDIKDLENEINNRFKGKRTLSEIEAEISEIEYLIDEQEKNLQAANIAIEVLKNSYENVRDSFGPALNKKVLELFKNFTNGKYTNVMVSDKYEIKLSLNNDLLPSRLLSNGANDQLFLALRLAFVEMIFNNKDVAIYLDDAFIQYDDNRIRNILELLSTEKFAQLLIFTCQNREALILKEKNIKYNYISI